MLGGLTREVRWRDVWEETPQRLETVLVAYFSREDKRMAGAAFWDGRAFLETDAPYRPIRNVTHWAPFPELPKAEEMRRAFRTLFVDTEAP